MLSTYSVNVVFLNVFICLSQWRLSVNSLDASSTHLTEATHQLQTFPAENSNQVASEQWPAVVLCCLYRQVCMSYKWC